MYNNGLNSISGVSIFLIKTTCCVVLLLCYSASFTVFEAVISFNNTTYNNTSPWTVANLSIGLLYRVFKCNHIFQESKATSFRTFTPGFFYFVHFMLYLCGILFLFQIMDYNVILHRWYPYIKMKYGWYTINMIQHFGQLILYPTWINNNIKKLSLANNEGMRNLFYQLTTLRWA